MSDEFIQFRFPCAECIVRAACKNKPTNIDDLYMGYNKSCLTIPKLKDKKSYHKMLVECWINLGYDLFDKPEGYINKVPFSYIRAIHQMASIMQYMVNSTSWREGTLYSFDKTDINEKLKSINKLTNEGK